MFYGTLLEKIQLPPKELLPTAGMKIPLSSTRMEKNKEFDASTVRGPSTGWSLLEPNSLQVWSYVRKKAKNCRLDRKKSIHSSK